MPEEYCVYEANHQTRIATVTFNQPDRLNAMRLKDDLELTDKVLQAEGDDDIKVIVMRGAGRCFGTGRHVDEIGHVGFGRTGKERRPSQRVRLLHDNLVSHGRRGLHQTVLFCSKATIAQVHGYCYGGHLGIALASDIVVASEDALFTHPGYRYIGGMWSVAQQMQTMGIRATKEMMLTGRAFAAEEALQCGLVNKVVPLEELEQEVGKMAAAIALMPKDAIVMSKANFELALDIAGATTSYTAGWITHSLQTNIRYEPDEYSLLKARRDKGVKGAIWGRESHFSADPLARKQV